MQGIDNFVEQETGTTGTGDLSLTSVNGGRDFSESPKWGIGGNEEFFYAIWHPNVANEYEFGLGHLVDSTTLSRDTVIDSSNSDSFVSFSSGTKKLICDVPAERVLDKNRMQGYLQPNGLVIANNSTNPNTDIDVSVGGNLWVHDPADETNGIVVDAPVASPAVQLDTSGVGGRLNSTLDANQWYEPGIIATADGTVDYVAWKPANRPTASSDLPSGYDYYRAMGTPGKTWWIKTDGSSNILEFDHTSDGWMQWDDDVLENNFSILFNSSSPNGDNTINISAQSPPTTVNLDISNFRLTSNGTDNGSIGVSNKTSPPSAAALTEFHVGSNANERTGGPVRLNKVTDQQFFINASNLSNLRIGYIPSFKAVK